MKKKPIRVLHVIGIMNRGGAETMIMNLYRQIDREAVQFDFVENAGEEAAFDAEILSLGGRIYHCPRFTGFNFFAYRNWWNAFFTEHASEYGVVHGHIGSTASIYLYEAKKHGIYTIAHSHNTDGKSSFSQMVYKAFSYNTRNIADFFFACSEQAGLDRFGRRVVKDKLHYIVFNNAIDTKQFCFDAEARKRARKAFDILEDAFVVGHVGRFSEQKNHIFLLDVFAEIKKREPNALLLMVGDGELRPIIEEKVERLHIGESVIFTGIRDDVAELMQAMDLLLFPSIFEGLPVTLVEAQSTGLPCVISSSIPQDAIISKDLVSVQSLESSTEEWAELVLSRKKEKRTDHHEAIARAGFDIQETAKWLGEFYLEKARERNTANGLHTGL